MPESSGIRGISLEKIFSLGWPEAKQTHEALFLIMGPAHWREYCPLAGGPGRHKNAG